MLANIILKKSEIDFNKYDRKKVGYFSGMIGILLNLLLGTTKLVIGLIVNSIAVIADATNNYSDAIYSIATIFGFKISGSPADENHPYGYGRVEYITTLVISIFIIMIGLQFVKTSIDRIINPEQLNIDTLGTIFLGITVIIKIWMSIFNKKLGKVINSGILKAVSLDCLTDAISTSIILISLIFSNFTIIPIDGIVGLVASSILLYSGYSLIKETISQLIGESLDKELVKSVLEDIKKYDGIKGVHNYTFHEYGHSKTIATVDIEMPANMSLINAHKIASVIEKEIYEKYNIFLIIHMEPLGEIYSKKEIDLKKEIIKWKEDYSYIKSMHDFGIYNGLNYNFVGLQLVLNGEKLPNNFDEELLKLGLENIIKKYDDKLKHSITFLYEYI